MSAPRARQFKGGKLVVATHNAGKVEEIAALLGPLGVEIVSAGDLGLPEPVEDGESFLENARIKAHAAAKASGLPALSDDSGLEIDALDGAPGVHTADWAETATGRDWMLAMTRAHEALVRSGEEEPHEAAFVCTLCLAWPDGHDEFVEGWAEGRVIWPPRGEIGFGYDPVFVPEGESQTFAEMPPERKAALSHRTAAFRVLAARCFGAGSRT